MDRLFRRSLVASFSLHALAVLVVLLPAFWHHRTLIPPSPVAPLKPPPALRLILPRAAVQAPPPLPALSEAQRAGWAQHGLEREMAEVITPLPSGTSQHTGSNPADGRAPVRLPEVSHAHLERALRLDADATSERELTREHERLSDAATLLERLMRDHLASDWNALQGPFQTPVLYLSVTVDAEGRLLDASRLNSSGSGRLDEAIDHWLHDPGSAIGLPAIRPGVPHVLGVVLYVR